MKIAIDFFHKGLRKTAVSLSRKLVGCFSDTRQWTEDDYDMLEAALIGADFGIGISSRIVEKVKEGYKLGKIRSEDDIFTAAKKEIIDVLQEEPIEKLDTAQDGLNIILFVGVNGCGKTTTIGKIAHLLKNDNKKVMLAAADTFRAAATEQLKHWGEKSDVYVVSSKQGADPASVVFDAVTAAKTRNYDYLLIDTAGRQHTHKSLMSELEKIIKTIDKLYKKAFERVIVVDGSVGSNAISQVREFSNICKLSGVICTKLDGTYKGGMVVAIKNEFKLPILYIGLGEGKNDITKFDPELFADSIFEKMAI